MAQDSDPELIDWGLAERTALRLVRRGPDIGYTAAERVVASLRQLADEATGHVERVTGLTTPPHVPPAAVVDRPAWLHSNVAAFGRVMTPVTAALVAGRGPQNPLTKAVGRRVTGVQVGTLLSYLAGRVLGQFEIFVPPGPDGQRAPGRLLLVAPNIVAAEQALDVDPHDFRLWVCLHEETHRVQFTAVPWLREYVEGELAEFVRVSDLDPAALLARLRGSLDGLVDAVRGRGERSLVELVQTPAQREVLDRVQAFMSLVEGHAEYVMDQAGPAVIPSLQRIRSRFDRRRAGSGPVDKVVRRVLGLDLKMRQYAEGARFVRGVVDRVGMTEFNRVWTSPQTLPTRREINDPGSWVERVLGPPQALPA